MLNVTPRTLTVVLSAASCAVLASCGGLPSTFDVQQKFAAEHPQYVVTSVTSRAVDAIEHRSASDGGYIHGNTVFTITYRKSVDSRTYTYERSFHRVAEGWVEDSQKSR